MCHSSPSQPPKLHALKWLSQSYSVNLLAYFMSYYSVNISFSCQAYFPSLSYNLTSATYFKKLVFLITFMYDYIKKRSIDTKYFNLIWYCNWQRPFSFSDNFRLTPHIFNGTLRQKWNICDVNQHTQCKFTWYAGRHHFLVFC